MASIFTYDPDPPKLHSPWPSAAGIATGKDSEKASLFSSDCQVDQESLYTASYAIQDLPVIDSIPVTRLQAEPQEGATEYKLHLLLRPRKSLSFASTGAYVPGSHHSKSAASTPRSVSEASLSIAHPAASSSTSRQHRLEQLTTQLLWRLQQSSPYHSTSATNLILPTLPEAKAQMQPPDRPAKLLPGLEESKGALYEIGISDDGALIGLTIDEMNESLNNLGAMAASLGCSMQVLRMYSVGDCEWLEPSLLQDSTEFTVQSGKLCVAEAYIQPDLRRAESSHDGSTSNPVTLSSSNGDSSKPFSSADHSFPASVPVKEQLRISLTGATTCGKSSLLGTLSTSTLDNSRGKSRLSLLKHRHEIASGVTSSVVQELVGYHDVQRNGDAATEIINYATENVSSWTDIHTAAVNPGRLAVISDSAGHPRYRRTTVRGLIGWAPHWTFLCIAANDDSNASDVSSTSLAPDDEEPNFLGANAHISIAHLDLCLKLQVPLAVIVTKFDLATRSNFRPVLSVLLSRLKEAGRTPELLSNTSGNVMEEDLQTIPTGEASDIIDLTEKLKTQPYNIVPILFTSAVKGTGITKMHALLRHLPAINANLSNENTNTQRIFDEKSRSIFHIEDLFNLPVTSIETHDSSKSSSIEAGSVISGHLAAGSIATGDELWIGPFSDATHNPITNTIDETQSSANDLASGFLTPRSFNDALVKVTSSTNLRSPPKENEWRRIKAVSVRNLRMPVHVLRHDQVGTIGAQPLARSLDIGDKLNMINIPGKRLSTSTSNTPPSQSQQQQPLPIRKGMVVISGARPTSAHAFTADFHIDEASSIVVGAMVVVYCASVRASAKVVAVALQSPKPYDSPQRIEKYDDDIAESSTHSTERYQDRDDNYVARQDEFGFRFDIDEAEDENDRQSAHNSVSDEELFVQARTESILVTFQLITYREWLETGSKVLVMPGGGASFGGSGAERGVKSFGGLEGFVGRIVETFG